jgi:hypothetical protein
LLKTFGLWDYPTIAVSQRMRELERFGVAAIIVDEMQSIGINSFSHFAHFNHHTGVVS